jgi:hypothetical protein
MKKKTLSPIGLVHCTRKLTEDDNSSDFSQDEIIFYKDKVEGLKLYLEGLDAIDGTPVLDIKPWVSEFGPRGSVFQLACISELMKSRWK